MVQGVVAYVFNPNTPEVEADRSVRVEGQPDLLNRFKKPKAI